MNQFWIKKKVIFSVHLRSEILSFFVYGGCKNNNWETHTAVKVPLHVVGDLRDSSVYRHIRKQWVTLQSLPFPDRPCQRLWWTIFYALAPKNSTKMLCPVQSSSGWLLLSGILRNQWVQPLGRKEERVQRNRSMQISNVCFTSVHSINPHSTHSTSSNPLNLQNRKGNK